MFSPLSWAYIPVIRKSQTLQFFGIRSHCLKADLKRSLQAIQRVNKDENKKTKLLRRRAIQRFIDQKDVDRIYCSDSFVKEIIRAYRNYYRQALLNPKDLLDLGKQLDSSLKNIAKSENIKIKSHLSQKSLESFIAKEINRRGYHSLFGTVAPFRSLMVWKNQTAEKFVVELPEGKQVVKVIFMEDFLELSWLHYATFGRYYVGGWAKKRALYCVKQAYNVNSSVFKIHYLVHEAQHFSDYKKYPRLQLADLEFRAKLAELSFAKNPNKFIKKLELEAKNDINKPHSFAAYKILQRIKKSSAKNIRESARTLLARHSQSLKSRGAKTVTTYLVNI